MYLAVVYQDWVVVRVHVLVGVIFKEWLIPCHVKVFHAGLLGVEAVKLVLGEMIDDARAIWVPDHVDGCAETVPTSPRRKVTGEGKQGSKKSEQYDF